MKTVQETILELVRSRSVLETAMKQAGPPADCKKSGSLAERPRCRRFPRRSEARSAKGAEFGKTEVFILPCAIATATAPWH